MFDAIKKRISEQIQSYKQLSFIRRSQTKTKTVFATITYILSILVLVPSVIHLAFDALMHLTTSTLSIGFYNLSTYIQG